MEYTGDLFHALETLLRTQEYEAFLIPPLRIMPFQQCKKHAQETPAYNGAGFFFTLDQDKKYVRCGAIEDLEMALRTLFPQPGDVYLCLAVAYLRKGYADMRHFKHKFKQFIQAIPLSPGKLLNV